MNGTGVHPLRAEVRLLLHAAMVVFVWTVVIGILNGTDIVDFDRKIILSHVHAGTLGWITTSVFAASFWLFGRDAGQRDAASARLIARYSVVILPVFALTFAFTYDDPRAVVGTLALLAILAMFWWLVGRARRVELSTVHLGFVAAVATSVIGGILGVLLATEIATGSDVLPDGGEDAHPATMVVGFLIPVGMALAEWGLRGTESGRAGRLGVAQMACPFVGGLLLMAGLLLDIDPLPPLATIIELVGVVIFFKRLWQPLRSVSWQEPGPNRYAAASAIAIVANIVFLNYLAGANGGDLDLVPTHQLLAMDHMMFVGVLTNAIFALLLVATARRSRWPGLDTAVFIAMNVGLLGFFLSLLGEWIGLRQIATPILGIAILVGLAERTLSLLDHRSDATLPGAAPASI